MKFRIAALALLLASTALHSPLAAQDSQDTQASQETEEPLEEQQLDNALVAPETPDTDTEDEAAWDVNAPFGAAIRQVPIQTDEGTWMDVDVSPDGRRVAFSLLGDIYTVPIAGGTPTRIAEGMAWEVQPRFSPDGRRIAFTSDRGGGDNIWIMNADGSDKRALTKETFRLLNQPSWSPDGEFIVAKKHFTTGRSLGTGEVWLYHVSGGGGVKLVERASEALQKELGEPIYAADGKSVFYTRNTTPGPIFEYAQDSVTGIFDIERYDLETGEVTTAVSGYGGAVRPTPSPDGRRIAFVRRDKDQSQLWFKDLVSGEEAMLYDALDRDVQETWAVTGVYPNMDWTPDSGSVVFWAGGKLRRVAVGGEAREIPFAIADTRGVANAPHPAIEVAPDTFQTNMIRFAAVSPSGRNVVYESLGKLYVRPVAGGTPRRLTNSSDAVEMHPSWSRDGKRLAFVRWTDEGLAQIIVTDADGGNARSVTSAKGHYSGPRFSPDGRTIVFEKGVGGYLTDPDWSENPGTYRVSAHSGVPQLLAKDLGNPQFGADNDRVFMTESGEDGMRLISTDLNGEARRTHAEGELVTEYVVAGDGRHVAFRQNYEAFVAPLLPGGATVTLGKDADALPVTAVSKGGADFLSWSDNGARLNWTMGPGLYSVATAQMFTNAPANEDAPKFVAPIQPVAMLLSTRRAAKATGTVALVGARILTMAGDGAGAIEDGVVVIQGDRIAAVGPRATVTIPAGARRIDMAGRVIMPGLVDAHAHGAQGTGDLVPQQNWSLVQNLALGTTTLHDPSSRASLIFAAAERQRAGLLLAPRIFSTGEIIYGAKAPGVYAQIDSYDDALAHVRRIKAQGGISVKNYNQPRREQRQQVVRAAAAENMLVVAEGGSLYGMDMALVADGNSTLEHNIPVEVLYDDALQMFGQSQTNYTPTLVVTYGGLAGDPYWRQATDVWKNPLLVHTPPKQLLAETGRRVTAPDWAFVDDESAREAKKLALRGVKVSIGAHGQQAGIGAHWELWSFVRGGMTPVEALRAGTIEPARSLGMERDTGSLEVGKLADLIVLVADPSVDIKNSDDIAQVMLGGRLYDARTMNEVETGDAKRRAYWWE